MEKKLRRSRQRDRILELLHYTDQHPTAGWLYDRLKQEFPNLSLGTVYRNLGILVEQGTVRKLDSGSTFDRFEINRGDHVHVVCRTCGRIEDVDMVQTAELQRAAHEQTGMTIVGQRIELFGICDRCEAEQPQDQRVLS